MPERISVDELWRDVSRVMARAAAGEEFVVTERGRVLARIVPECAGDRPFEGEAVRERLRPLYPGRRLDRLLEALRADRA
jgi:antitoxin (DNA-binding transcriptional repressor) of toxin-antitoxin stability system